MLLGAAAPAAWRYSQRSAALGRGHNEILSISVGSSSGARELLTRFETGERCSTSRRQAPLTTLVALTSARGAHRRLLFCELRLGANDGARAVGARLERVDLMADIAVPRGDRRSFRVSHNATHSLTRACAMPLPRSSETSALVMPATCHSFSVEIGGNRLCREE